MAARQNSGSTYGASNQNRSSMRSKPWLREQRDRVSAKSENRQIAAVELEGKPADDCQSSLSRLGTDNPEITCGTERMLTDWIALFGFDFRKGQRDSLLL